MATEFNYTREWTDAEAFPLLSFTKNWENPEDYPTYEPDEMQVRRDMQSLHDEVKDFLNNELIPRVIAEDATVEGWAAQETARSEAESARSEAETARADAEQGRADAETARVQTEAARVETEAARATAESARVTAETGRVEAEAARVTAEQNRATVESARVTAEAARAAAESARVTAEANRESAESGRAVAEAARSSAETARSGAEAKRVSAEQARVSAEKARADAESARTSEFATLKTNVEAATNSANTAADKVNKMTVSATDLTPGSAATVTKGTNANGGIDLKFGIPEGAQGKTGNGIKSIAKTGGSGAAGTYDTYTITMTDGSTFNFRVLNGANGKDGDGTGDMVADTYDPQGKRTDIFAYVEEHGGAQSDWNENDPESKAYVKNRTHYTTAEYIEEFNGEVTCLLDNDFNRIDTIMLQENTTYKVTFYGTEYVLETVPTDKAEYTNFGGLQLGNLIDYPFRIVSGLDMINYEELRVIDVNEGYEGTFALAIAKLNETVHTLDEKFLPESVKAQPDWEQNVYGQPGYILNRPGGYYDSDGDAVKFSERFLPSDILQMKSKAYEPPFGGSDISGMIYSNGKFMAFRDVTWMTSAFISSTDGFNWTNEAEIPIGVYHIACGDDGRIVAVQQNGGTGAYSDDGIVWTEMSMPDDSLLGDIVYGNGTYVVLYGGGRVLYSKDGITWSECNLPNNVDGLRLTFGAGKFIALPNNYKSVIFHSEDGISWTQESLPCQVANPSIAYGDGRFVVVDQVTECVLYSDNGTSWTQVSEDGLLGWELIAYGAGKFVAYYSGAFYYSSDGISWTEATIDTGKSFYARGIVYGAGMFIAHGYNKIAISYDGVNWFTEYDALINTEDEDVANRVRELIHVQSDWNQNDPEAKDYVKNRTHWVEPSVGFVLANDTYFHGETYTITVGSDGYAEQVYVDAGFVDEDGEREGGRFRVTWNDVEYEVNHGSRSENMIPELGYDRDDLPFTVGGLRSTTILTLNPELGPYAPGTYDVTVKIEYLEPDTYHKIPMEFMPRNLATVEYVDTNINAKAPNSHASSSTTYGRGNSSYYGHVKLSDATDSTSNAGSGVAASPKAVKAAYDLAKSALDGGAKITTGSYTATDKDGSSNPNCLTFDFVPEVVFILESDKTGSPMFTLFCTFPKALKNSYTKYGYMVLNGALDQMSNNAYAKMDGTSLYWYSTNARNQMNSGAYNYRYVAIG